jgi:hypothetical protein
MEQGNSQPPSNTTPIGERRRIVGFAALVLGIMFVGSAIHQRDEETRGRFLIRLPCQVLIGGLLLWAWLNWL